MGRRRPAGSTVVSKRGRRWRGSITNQELLYLLEQKILIVDLATAKLYKLGKEIVPTIVGREGVNGTRYRFEICHDGKKRTICRSRMVYMAGSGFEIPRGFEVHHLNEDRYDDRWNNLVMLTEADHRKIHCQVKEPF